MSSLGIVATAAFQAISWLNFAKRGKPFVIGCHWMSLAHWRCEQSQTMLSTSSVVDVLNMLRYKTPSRLGASGCSLQVQEDAVKAIQALDGLDWRSRTLKTSQDISRH